MCLAADYADEIAQCNDNMIKLFAVHAEFTDNGSIIRLRREAHREYTIFFKDDSFVKKLYLGNERSVFRVYS